MPSVLFVCTANICRSPLAEGLFRHYVQTQPDATGWSVASAGTWATEGRPAHVFSQTVAAGRGIDLSTHRSRNVTGPILDRAHLVLTMEQGHKDALVREFPAHAPRVFLLSEMAGARHDIPDPIGLPLAHYQQLARQLDRLFTEGMVRIRELSREEVG